MSDYNKDADITEAGESSGPDVSQYVKSSVPSNTANNVAEAAADKAAAATASTVSVAQKGASTAVSATKGAFGALTGGVTHMISAVGSLLGIPTKGLILLMSIVMGGAITIFGVTVYEGKQMEMLQQTETSYSSPKCDTTIPVWNSMYNGSPSMQMKRDSANAESAIAEQKFILSNAKKLYRYLAALDYTDEAIAGILSNAQAESDIDALKFTGDDMIDSKLKDVETGSADVEDGNDYGYEYTGQDLIDEYFVFLTTHHVNWTDYTKALLESEYKGYLTEEKCKITDGAYLPGIGMFQLPGERASSLFYFANCQLHPTDRDNDGNNDIVWEMPYQVAYMYLENFSDVYTTHYDDEHPAPEVPDATDEYTYITKYYGINEWAREQFFANREIIKIEKETSSRYPDSWNINFCLKANTAEYTVYEYYELLVSEHVESKIIKNDSEHDCPLDPSYKHHDGDGTGTSGDGNIPDGNGHVGGNEDVPIHWSEYTKHTITVQPKLYTLAVDPDDEDLVTGLENILKNRDSYYVDGWFTGLLHGNITVKNINIVDKDGKLVKDEDGHDVTSDGTIFISDGKIHNGSSADDPEVSVLTTLPGANVTSNYKYYSVERSSVEEDNADDRFEVEIRDEDGELIRGISGRKPDDVVIPDGSPEELRIYEYRKDVDYSFIDRAITKEWLMGHKQGVEDRDSPYNPNINTNIKIRQEMDTDAHHHTFDTTSEDTGDHYSEDWALDETAADKVDIYELKNTKYVTTSHWDWICDEVYDAFEHGRDINSNGLEDVQVPLNAAQAVSGDNLKRSNLQALIDDIEAGGDYTLRDRYMAYSRAVDYYNKAREAYEQCVIDNKNLKWAESLYDYLIYLNDIDDLEGDVANQANVVANNVRSDRYNYLTSRGDFDLDRWAYTRWHYDWDINGNDHSRAISGAKDRLVSRINILKDALQAWDQRGLPSKDDISDSNLLGYVNTYSVDDDSHVGSYKNELSKFKTAYDTYVGDYVNHYFEWHIDGGNVVWKPGATYTWWTSRTTGELVDVIGDRRSDLLDILDALDYDHGRFTIGWGGRLPYNSLGSGFVTYDDTTRSRVGRMTTGSSSGWSEDGTYNHPGPNSGTYGWASDTTLSELSAAMDVWESYSALAHDLLWDYYNDTYLPIIGDWKTNEWDQYKEYDTANDEVAYRQRIEVNTASDKTDRSDQYSDVADRGFNTWWYLHSGKITTKVCSNVTDDPNSSSYSSSTSNESNIIYYVGGPEHYIKYYHRYRYLWDKPYESGDDHIDYSSKGDAIASGAPDYIYEGLSPEDGYKGFLDKVRGDLTRSMEGLYRAGTDDIPDDLDEVDVEIGEDDESVKKDTTHQNGQDIAFENAAWFFWHYLEYDQATYGRDSIEFKEHTNTARKWYNMIKAQNWREDYDEYIKEEYTDKGKENPYKELMLSYLPYNPYDEIDVYVEYDETTGDGIGDPIGKSYVMIQSATETDDAGNIRTQVYIDGDHKRVLPDNYTDYPINEISVWRAKYDCGIGRFDNTSPSKAAVSMSYGFGSSTFAIDDGKTTSITRKTKSDFTADTTEYKIAEYMEDDSADDTSSVITDSSVDYEEEAKTRISNSTETSTDIKLMKMCTPAYVAVHNILKLKTDRYSSDDVAVATAIIASGYDDDMPLTIEEIKDYLCYDRWASFYGQNLSGTRKPGQKSYNTGGHIDYASPEDLEKEAIFVDTTIMDKKWDCLGFIVPQEQVKGFDKAPISATVRFSCLRPGDVLVSDDFICMFIGKDARSKYMNNNDFIWSRYAVCFGMQGDGTVEHPSTGLVCTALSIETRNIPTSKDNPIYGFNTSTTYHPSSGGYVTTDKPFLVYRPVGTDHEISEWYQLLKKVDFSSIHDGSTNTIVTYGNGSAEHMYAYGIDHVLDVIDDSSETDSSSGAS